MIQSNSGNELFPVFLQLNRLKVLLVGGGHVAMEKLSALLNNSPYAAIKLVAREISVGVRNFAASYRNVQLHERAFEMDDLEGIDVVVVASNNDSLNINIRNETRARHILLNVADKPDMCDFYLGSIVKKGNLKIGISTNGKSPTIAKRIKEVLDEALPHEIDETLEYMGKLRNQLKGDFTDKVKQLNAHTAVLVASNEKK